MLAAEANAVIQGLVFATNLGHREVIVETDSRLLINGVKGDVRNKAAHEAALIGVRVVELESGVSRPPLSLVQVLLSDGLPRPPI
ncbi:hypothetical protein L3X38_021989 [Prunus dulcis]|uniref:RNase H type-1 domain-containing protein n=1 Tax=Prunus dulcis TaxID=3755 RepID=A0AAD4VV96_PRUDU|nr:hypothetical protein L3X38_021989 [Prunus dulcis]